MASFLRTGKKIVAIGRNYRAHALELGNAPPSEPFFFLKPTTSYVQDGGVVEIPKGVVVHHEVELGVVIGKTGRDIPASSAMSHVAGYALAIDMTARNVQDAVKAKGLPWSAAKGFDSFNPISGFIPLGQVDNPHDLRLSLAVNDVQKQVGTTADMVFKIPQLIEHVSSVMTLEEGDLLLTGTPSGVGPVHASDAVSCALRTADGRELATLKVGVVARQGGFEFKG